MKKIIRFARIIIVIYLIESLAATIMWHAYPDQAWNIATHRGGLLILDWDQDGLWVTNPLTSYGDDWVAIYTR